MPRRKFGAEPRDRFTDDRQLLSDGVAKRLVGEEIGFRSPETAFAIQSNAPSMSFRRCRSRRIDQPGLGQHAGPDERLQCRLDRQIDPAAEQRRELSHHR